MDTHFNVSSEVKQVYLTPSRGSGDDTEHSDISIRDPSNSWNSALHLAVHKGNIKIVEVLLRHTPDSNQKDSQGFTPLMHAIVHGHDEIAELLLLNGAEVDASNNEDQSALHLAVSYSRDRMLKRLLQFCKGNSAVVNAYTKNGRTPLHIAIDVGSELAVESLLESGADVQCKAWVSE